MYEYHNPQADEAEEEHRLERIYGPPRWSRKHAGACPHCGSHDGLAEWYKEDLYPHAHTIDEGDQFYRDPSRDDVVYEVCPYCDTDATGYESMTAEQVREWLEG